MTASLHRTFTVAYDGGAVQGATGTYGHVAGYAVWQREAIKTGKPVYVMNVNGWLAAVEDVPAWADFVTFFPENFTDITRAPFPIAARAPMYATNYLENVRAVAERRAP